MDVMEGSATTLAAGDVFVVTADRPMTQEHAARLKEFGSAALPEGVRVLVLDPGYSFDVLPAVTGVSRVADNDRALLVSFRGQPTDDALRALHETLKALVPERSATLESVRASFNNAIDFALNDPEGLEFLRLWQVGDFEAIAEEWPAFKPGSEKRGRKQ
jgi:hypothetical protein